MMGTVPKPKTGMGCGASVVEFFNSLQFAS
jgi:hypothetical protein